nr:integrase core domain-containing protein [Brevibacterium aurantiacum]
MPWRSSVRVNFFDLNWLPRSLLTRIRVNSDRGVQFRSIRYGETLAESEVVASVGSRGDSYDNAMAEALNSVYKAELIDRKVWSGLIEVMAETSKWVAWYNQTRLHSAIGYRPPFEVHSEWINQSGTESAAA